MPAVLVHGVPETHELWDPLIQHLDRDDVVTLQLPGFGCPRPEGFEATKEEYVEWLVAEVESIGLDGPVDLVGHDWGGGFTNRLVSTRPDLVRSWVTDAAFLAHPEYVWHEFAKLWQTPEAGEGFFRQQLGVPAEQRGPGLEGFGVPADEAVRMASWQDETMADTILRLYRSAVDVMKEWSPDFVDVPAPGLVLVATDDPFYEGRLAPAAADRAGARVATLDGLGHWWMLQDPARSATVITGFWNSVG